MTRVQDASTRKAQGKRRPWRWLLMALLVPVVLVIAWLEPDEEDLFELCSTQGKPTIYRTVEAEGYFDGLTDNCWGCWRYLRNTDYEFIEFSLSKRRLDFDPIKRAWNLPCQPDSGGLSAMPRRADRLLHKDQPRCGKSLSVITGASRSSGTMSRQARYGYYRKELGTITSKSSYRLFHYWQTLHLFLTMQTSEILAETTDYGLNKYPHFRSVRFASISFCNDFYDRIG